MECDRRVPAHWDLRGHRRGQPRDPPGFRGRPVSQITGVSSWLASPFAVVFSAYDFYYSDGSSFEGTVFQRGAGYFFFDVTADLDTAKTLVGFSIFGYTGGRTYLDDASITTAAVPEPSTLLGCGITAVALAGYRLRRRAKDA